MQVRDIIFFVGLIVLVMPQARAEVTQNDQNKRIDYQALRHKHFALLPHNPMYLLPFVYNWTPHEDIYDEIKDTTHASRKDDLYKNQELELQISFAIPLVKNIGKRDWDLLFAYTHRAYWQIYNSAWSRPFRETNYTPELFTRYVYSSPRQFLGLKIYSVEGGYAHQSNGQIQQLSRGWDRLMLRTLMEAWGVKALVTGWHRLTEEQGRDDNPSITQYMGHGQIELIKSWEQHTLHFKMPLFAQYRSYDFKYSHPLSEGIRFLVSFQTGHGHSLIEYDRSTQRLGIGFLMEDILY
jgi:phospholipase A1